MQVASAGAGAQDDGSASTPQWVVFTCDGHDFALPIGRVREILPPRPFTRLPGADAAVCGLIGLRGRVITVLDFGVAVGLAPAAREPGHRIVLLDGAARTVGLVVERVVGVAGGDMAEIERQAEALRALDAGMDELVGIGERDGRPFTIVDAERVLDRLLAAPSA